MRSHRLLRGGALIAAATLVAGTGACGGGTPSASSSAGASNVVINACGSGTGVVANFNPFTPASVLMGTNGAIYEDLFYWNRSKAGDVQPVLGLKYDFADGGQTINITTRSNVLWSDGQPFSADDVAFTFNMIKGNAKLNLGNTPFTSATATDSTHVTIKFSRPIYTKAPLILGGTAIVPKHVWSTVPDPAAFTNDKPVATGPFLPGKIGTQDWELDRNPKYWDPGKPKIKGIRFIQFSGNDATIAAVTSGQVDWCGGFMQDIDKQYVSKDPAHYHYINESQSLITQFLPNLDKSVLADESARKAVSQALDRDTIIKQAFSGYGKPVNIAYLPSPLYKDYIKPEYTSSPLLTYSTSAADQTLEQGGWTKGSDGIYTKGGKRLSFTITTVQGWSDYISCLQIATQELKAAGIEMKTEQVSYNAFATKQQTGDYDTIITNIYSDDGTPYSWYARSFDSLRTAAVGQQADSNFGRFRDPTVDAALRVIENTAPDQTDAIKAQLFKIQDVLASKLPFIPIQQSSSLIEYNTTKVTGFVTDDNHYAEAAPFSYWAVGIVAKNLVPVK